MEHGTHPTQIIPKENSTPMIPKENLDDTVTATGQDYSLKDAVENKQDIHLSGGSVQKLANNKAYTTTVAKGATDLKFNEETGKYDAYAGDKKMNVSVLSVADSNSNIISVKGIDTMKTGWVNNDISNVDYFKLEVDANIGNGYYRGYDSNNQPISGARYDAGTLGNSYISIDNPNYKE